MYNIQGCEVFTLSKVNPNAAGHTEPLTDATLHVAQQKRWTVGVSASPAVNQGPEALGDPAMTVHDTLSLPVEPQLSDLGLRGLHGVLAMKEHDPDLPDGVIGGATLQIDGIVPPLTVEGFVLKPLAMNEDRIFQVSE